jgi:hypothetical protein
MAKTALAHDLRVEFTERAERYETVARTVKRRRAIVPTSDETSGYGSAVSGIRSAKTASANAAAAPAVRKAAL